MSIILYVGMDVHKESYTLCTFCMEKDEIKHTMKMAPTVHNVLQYLDSIKRKNGNEEIEFRCGYEAGCLGYTLYRDLTAAGVNCVILAPSTMAQNGGTKRIKTDSRDAANIAKCLAYHTYKPVAVPTTEDEQVKEYIRMRDDMKAAEKRVKQQILAFCLRHNLRFEGTKDHWTQGHLNWLHALKLPGLDQETLLDYLLELDHLREKLARIDRRIEELATLPRYADQVRRLCCFIGVKTHTALAVISEVGDFERFAKADRFASFLGLTPGEHSSSESQHRLPITKAGNAHVRRLLVEAAHSFGRGKIGYKSAELRRRQEGLSPQVVAYADKANERLRRKYYHMTLNNGKKANIAKVAVARELACFFWGILTNHFLPSDSMITVS